MDNSIAILRGFIRNSSLYLNKNLRTAVTVLNANPRKVRCKRGGWKFGKSEKKQVQTNNSNPKPDGYLPKDVKRIHSSQ